ncbi:hypothetical protein GQ43DRAFT_418975 [Delitschia confertaspora ATCC 74209]|uniref:Uncharacterized protein n=1 Tax=Delitschia confertaspora ATCC 74209 TaxID=1513339 RepID=A0A9P4JKT1_9PLEO|nr:hypothetical protein GQ43DRAFT_418975 [Delitschia confertaspora ATCC 74209]
MATTDSKPTLPALKTPLSATYPSELRSPMVQSASALTPTFFKREESLKTPITPPSAYLDFLKTLSPVLMSPLPTGTSFKFEAGGNRPTSTASVTSLTSTASSASCPPTSAPITKTAPTSPASSRASSCCNCDSSKEKEPTEIKKEPVEPPKSASAPPAPVSTLPPTKPQAINIPPPSPFMRPQSARTPRLYIPQSPYSPAGAAAQSPMSARSVQSPYSAVSPKTWDLDKRTGRTRRVSVREVVTRTVTYSNTPVDKKAPGFPLVEAAPRGKRRKLE